MSDRHDPDHDTICDRSDSHLVIVAPPGTGKTHLSVRLAAQYARDLESHQRVLLVTFSNQARAQLETAARLRNISPDLRRRIEITNYHSFFYHAVWANRRALGLPLTAQVGSGKRRKRALSEVVSAGAIKSLDDNGALYSLAEHSFACFRDTRTPTRDDLLLLLERVKREHQAGSLVFDDLGALFWKLLDKYPTIAKAYATRYSVVIADEHQDASELQDAFVRRLGKRKLVIFADPMQLIYGFRGSDPDRLAKHMSECVGGARELRTPHRWQGKSGEGAWLLAVRERLQGRAANARRPDSVCIVASGYTSEMKNAARVRALDLRKAGCTTVAIIVRNNDELADLRSYLSRKNLFIRQLGGNDFEESYEEMEQLPLLNDWTALAHFAIDRLAALVPAVEDIKDNAKARVRPEGIKIDARCRGDVKAILTALLPMRDGGTSRYFLAMVVALEELRKMGHNSPRLDAVHALRATAESLGGDQVDIDEALKAYANSVVAHAQRSFQFNPGVFLLTAHQAKGKEFDAVIIFDASAWKYPDREEDRRVFYVALTRATRSWTIIKPGTNASPLLRHL